MALRKVFAGIVTLLSLGACDTSDNGVSLGAAQSGGQKASGEQKPAAVIPTDPSDTGVVASHDSSAPAVDCGSLSCSETDNVVTCSSCRTDSPAGSTCVRSTFVFQETESTRQIVSPNFVCQQADDVVQCVGAGCGADGSCPVALPEDPAACTVTETAAAAAPTELAKPERQSSTDCFGPDRSAADSFCGGIGSAEFPYLICNATQLNEVRNHLSSHFKLQNDVDLANLSFYTIPDFKGGLDGAGHTIANWTYLGDSVDGGCKDNVGLFTTVSDAKIENLKLVNFNVTSNRKRIGGLVGLLASSQSFPDNSDPVVLLDTAIVHSSIRSGLIKSTGDVNSSTQSWGVGGLVGGLRYASLVKTFSGATVDGGHAYAAGVLTGGESCGCGGLGLSLLIEDSYASGNASGYWMSGSLMGGLGGGGSLFSVVRSYASGRASPASDGNGWSGSNVGGLVGSGNGSPACVNSYYDKGQNPKGGCGTGVTAAQLTTPATYATWDFAGIWAIVFGQNPTLR